jgi:hypothetical protein
MYQAIRPKKKEMKILPIDATILKKLPFVRDEFTDALVSGEYHLVPSRRGGNGDETHLFSGTG